MYFYLSILVLSQPIFQTDRPVDTHTHTLKMASVEKRKNSMREVRIGKLCLNICVGESGDKLTRAAKVWGGGVREGGWVCSYVT